MLYCLLSKCTIRSVYSSATHAVTKHLALIPIFQVAFQLTKQSSLPPFSASRSLHTQSNTCELRGTSKPVRRVCAVRAVRTHAVA